MSIYHNHTANAAITDVEFTPVSNGNFTFFYIDNPLKIAGAKQWLTSPAIGQEIIAETDVDGHRVLVTHGDKTRDELLTQLRDKGDHFKPHRQAKGWMEYAWPARSILGFTGQGLQLTSGFMSSSEKLPLIIFAVCNLAANTMGLTLGAQRSEDKHRLRFLKTTINDDLQNHLPKGEALSSPDETLAKQRADMREPLSPSQKTHAFLKRNSVIIGELGLRYLGAFALAFPINKWGKGWAKLKTGALKEAFHAGRHDSMLTVNAGLGSLLGKTIAFASKAEDPYDPKPKTMLDTIREKYTFRLGGWIESVAFGSLAFDGYRKSHTLSKKKPVATMSKQEYRNFLSGNISGAGATLFTGAYIIRHWAKFGVREVNMEELSAHVTDSLAKMPPEELPQLMADTAAAMKEHFKDKPMDFGKVFTELMTDLYRYHHIALDNLGTEPEERAPALAQSKKIHAKQLLKSGIRGADKPSVPPATHTEKLQASAPAQSVAL